MVAKPTRMSEQHAWRRSIFYHIRGELMGIGCGQRKLDAIFAITDLKGGRGGTMKRNEGLTIFIDFR